MKIYSAKIIDKKTGKTKTTLGFYKTEKMLIEKTNRFLELAEETIKTVIVETTTDHLFQ